MKKLLLIILFLPFFCFAQQKEFTLDCDYEIKQITDSTYKIQVQNFDSLHAGETCFLSWMSTGKDKPNGILLVFDENGIRRIKAIYKDGIRIGTHLMWYSSGELESETTWESDLYFNSTGYFKSGKIKNTAENGNRPNAVYKSYYENGQLESLSDWSGVGDKMWYENGQIKSFRDLKTSTYTEWYENGKIKLTGKLMSGSIRTGVWKYYNQSGKLTRELIYDDHTKAGSFFDESGYSKEKKY